MTIAQLKRIDWPPTSHDDSSEHASLAKKLQELGIRPYSPASIKKLQDWMVFCHTWRTLYVAIDIIATIFFIVLVVISIGTLLLGSWRSFFEPTTPSWLVRIPVPTAAAAGLLFWLMTLLFKRSPVCRERWRRIYLHSNQRSLPENATRIVQQLESFCEKSQWMFWIMQWSKIRPGFGYFLMIRNEDDGETFFLEVWK